MFHCGNNFFGHLVIAGIGQFDADFQLSRYILLSPIVRGVLYLALSTCSSGRFSWCTASTFVFSSLAKLYFGRCNLTLCIQDEPNRIRISALHFTGIYSFWKIVASPFVCTTLKESKVSGNESPELQFTTQTSFYVCIRLRISWMQQ